MIKAVYDACVLYSAPLRNILLCLAEEELVSPLWSEEIRDEWVRNLLRNRPDLTKEKLDRTHREMIRHFPSGLVRGYEAITPTLSLPDPNDRHVLAVAIHAKAEYIVTFNLDDFPKTILLPYDIEAISPDNFVLRLIQDDPRHVLQAVRNHRLSLQHPAKSVNEYLVALEKQGLPKTVVFLRERETDI